MNILHITKEYPNAVGGDAVVVSNLARLQAVDGHSVAILASNCDDIEVLDEAQEGGKLPARPAASFSRQGALAGRVGSRGGGLPVLPTKVGILRDEDADRVAGIVLDKTPEALTTKMHDFLKAPALREELRANASEEAKKYTWQSIATSVRTIYMDVAP